MGSAKVPEVVDDLDGCGIMIKRPRNSIATNKTVVRGDDELTGHRLEARAAAGHESVLMSIAAIPKPMSGTIATIQENAIRSWAQLAPHVEVFLFGDLADEPLVALARETGARLFPVDVNERGTPRIQTAWQRFRDEAEGRALVFTNADIVFDTSLPEAARALLDSPLDRFLAIGQRIDLNIDERIRFEDRWHVNQWFATAHEKGRAASVVCKDFFIFTPDLYPAGEMPDFLVGRGNWDNWMVDRAHRKGVPVVDVTPVLLAIHQLHGHDHVAGGRRAVYVTGPEARQNQRLAGGRRLVRGSMATWELTDSGPVKRRIPELRLVADLPRFARLLRDLLFLGYFWGCQALQL